MKPVEGMPSAGQAKREVRRLGAALGVLALCVSGSAWSGTGTSSVPVSITVLVGCVIKTPQPMAFGSVTAAAGNVDTIGMVNVACTNGTPWFVSIDNGQNVLAAQRRMKSTTLSTPRLFNYNVYSDAAHTVPFPIVAGTLGSGNSGGTGIATDQLVQFYGRVPAGQALPPPDVYGDALVITLTW